MKLKITSLLLLSSISGFSIAEQAVEPAVATPAAPTVPAATVLVTINGQAITDADVFAFNALQGNKVPLNTEQGQMQVMNQIINTTLVAQVGSANNLHKNTQVAAAIKMASLQVLAEAQIGEHLASAPITEEEIKAVYDEKFSPDKLTEYKVRHILVKEEQQAKDVIKALDEGQNFAELAKEKSLDPSKSNGGGLGWIGPDQVVKPFGDALASLQKGKYSAAPVQTQFGWHIILVEDSRPQEPPKLEDVKSQFQTQIQQQRLSDYINGLREIAKIQVAAQAEEDATATAAPKPEEKK